MNNTLIDKIINLQELRIGNCLFYEGKIVYVTKLSFDIREEYEKMIGFCYLDSFAHEYYGSTAQGIDKVRQIPLTAEWLQKFGFVESKSYDSKQRNFKKEGFDQLADYGGQIIILPEVGFASLSCGYYENQIDCPYVHRLQNLYFALTGEELIINHLQP